MPPLLNEEERALDPYALLEVAVGASDKDIEKAYRKASLKWHPDKNQTPEAGTLGSTLNGGIRADLSAVMFRKITVSLEILLDGAKRNYLDTKLEDDKRKRAKYEQLDKKRKEMVDVSALDYLGCADASFQALNAREEDAKRAKVEQVQRRREQAEEEEIKEAGKRMLEEAQKRIQRAQAEAQKAASGTSNGSGAGAGPSRPRPTSNGHTPQPTITSDELTLILTFPSSPSGTLQSTLESRYGPISHLVLKDPPPNPNKKKGKAKAVVEFAPGNWGGCWACWRDHLDGSRGIEGAKVRWLKGETPSWVEWASSRSNSVNENGALHSRPTLNGDGPPATSAPTFDSAPDLGGSTMADLLASHGAGREAEKARKAQEDEYESMTLLRMRQSERERLAEQIRREEEDTES